MKKENNPENRDSSFPENKTSKTIEHYIADLSSKKPSISERARNYLVAAGESAMRALITALSSSNAIIRWEVGKVIENSEIDWSVIADQEILSLLSKNLINNDGFVRLNARNSLIKIGSKAVPTLIEALSSKQVLKRWEAAKALSQIADPAATNALVNAMDDRVFDVRWLAAEGLIAIGSQVIEPLLYLLKNHPDSVRLREGIHHVIYAFNKKDPNEILQPVINALEDSEAVLEVPWAVEKALKLLKDRKLINGQPVK
jgi:HEAT repeat protein